MLSLWCFGRAVFLQQRWNVCGVLLHKIVGGTSVDSSHSGCIRGAGGKKAEVCIVWSLGEFRAYQGSIGIGVCLGDDCDYLGLSAQLLAFMDGLLNRYSSVCIKT